MTRRITWFAALATAVVLLGSTAAVPSPGDLVLAVKPLPEAQLDRIRTRLAHHGFTLGPLAWTSGRYDIHLVSPGLESSWQDAVAAMGSVSDINDILLVGELLDQVEHRFTVYSGRILIEVEAGTTENEAASWGKDVALALRERSAHSTTTYLFDAPVPARQLVALQTLEGTAPVVEIQPVIYELGEQVGTGGGYHRIPSRRNILGVFQRGNRRDRMKQRRRFRNSRIVNLRSWDSPLWLLVMNNEKELVTAQQQLRKLPWVIHAGAAISTNPPAILTGQLTVKFKRPIDFHKADLTVGSHILELERPLPYVPNGYLFTNVGDGYAVYDIVQEFMGSDQVHYAVPNLYLPLWNADTTGCPAEQVHTDHDYIRDIGLCEAWELVEDKNEPLTVAVLDEGINCSDETDLGCSELKVSTVINFETMDTCNATVSTNNWCTTCQGVITDSKDHGLKVGLVIGAEHGIEPDERALFGVDKKVTLINARYPSIEGPLDSTTEIHLADALIWMAGGDPAWSCGSELYPCTAPSATCLPGLLDEEHRADIINLSFRVSSAPAEPSLWRRSAFIARIRLRIAGRTPAPLMMPCVTNRSRACRPGWIIMWIWRPPRTRSRSAPRCLQGNRIH